PSPGAATFRKRAMAAAQSASSTTGSAGPGLRRAASNGSGSGGTASSKARHWLQASTCAATASRAAPARLPAAKAASSERSRQLRSYMTDLLTKQVGKLFLKAMFHPRLGDIDTANCHFEGFGHFLRRAFFHGHQEESLPIPLGELFLDQLQRP